MDKKATITVFASNRHSFCDQGQGLAAGFKKCGYEVNSVCMEKGKKEEAYDKCRGEVIVSVGSWRDWPIIYTELVQLKKKVFPWIVSDDRVFDYVEEINKCPVVSTTSNYCKNIFKRDGVRTDTMQIIPEGIDTDFWRPITQDEKDKFKNLFFVLRNNEKPLFLMVGGEGTSKGAQEVIKAMGKKPHLDIYYLIKAMPSENSFYAGVKEKKLIKKYSLLSNTGYIMGFFSEEIIRFLFNMCDVCMAPSRQEGFGLPHVQAMACGKPVITCHGTAAEETSLNGITGYVVSSNPFKWKNSVGTTIEGVRANIGELRTAMEKVLYDAKLREEMGKNARKHIVDNYDSERIAKIFIEKMNI